MLSESQLNDEKFIKAFLFEPSNYIYGLYYSIPIITILVAHELGHYFMCRYYRIDATLPYFLPAPNIIGTFGAVIKIKEPMYLKKQIFDVGFAGPIMSFLLSIPASFIGILLSKKIEVPSDSITLGDSLIFKIITYLVHGSMSTDYIIHPIGFAGWVGFLVTAINLFPSGQLDGGHIFYAFSPKLHRYLSIATIIGFIVLGYSLWAGWYVWAVLLLIIGHKHPPVIDENSNLDFRRKILFLVIIFIFILSFTPVPVSF